MRCPTADWMDGAAAAEEGPYGWRPLVRTMASFPPYRQAPNVEIRGRREWQNVEDWNNKRKEGCGTSRTRFPSVYERKLDCSAVASRDCRIPTLPAARRTFQDAKAR